MPANCRWDLIQDLKGQVKRFSFWLHFEVLKLLAGSQEILNRLSIRNILNFTISFVITISCSAAAGGAVCLGTALQVGRSRVRFLIVSLEFFIDTILPAALWPWGRLSF